MLVYQRVDVEMSAATWIEIRNHLKHLAETWNTLDMSAARGDKHPASDIFSEDRIDKILPHVSWKAFQNSKAIKYPKLEIDGCTANFSTISTTVGEGCKRAHGN